MMLGIFNSNHCRLSAQSPCHFSSKTEKISEGILRAIYNELDEEKQLMMQLQAYSGQRQHCLNTINLHQIKNINKYEKYAILNIKSHQNKSRLEHICIVPMEITIKVLQFSTKNGNHRNIPFPENTHLWSQITKMAREKYKVRLTSHYLRKRFCTIAHETAMPTNHWDYLTDSKKTQGHDAESYNLNDEQQLVEEYDKFLVKRLSLENISLDNNERPIKEKKFISMEQFEKLNSKLDSILELIKRQQANQLQPIVSTPPTNHEKAIIQRIKNKLEQNTRNKYNPNHFRKTYHAPSTKRGSTLSHMIIFFALQQKDSTANILSYHFPKFR
jgi:hypothetical protein